MGLPRRKDAKNPQGGPGYRQYFIRRVRSASKVKRPNGVCPERQRGVVLNRTCRSGRPESSAGGRYRNQLPFGDNLTRLLLFPCRIKSGVYRPRYKICNRFRGNFIAAVHESSANSGFHKLGGSSGDADLEPNEANGRSPALLEVINDAEEIMKLVRDAAVAVEERISAWRAEKRKPGPRGCTQPAANNGASAKRAKCNSSISCCRHANKDATILP